MTPETRYARSGDVNIAYQIVGEGPRDLVLVPGFASNLEVSWEHPSLARFYERLASLGRLILFDKRGTGLSDRVPDMPNLETRMDDVRTVMDAAGSARATLIGFSEGAPMSCLFAATYPRRTDSLVLIAAFARRTWIPEYPYGPTRANLDAVIDALPATWGRGEGFSGVDIRAPSMTGDARYAEWYARLVRLSVSPGAAQALLRMNADIDVRDVLPSIRVPTLVLHRRGDRAIPVEMGRLVAQQIPDAKLVTLDGDDHHAWVGDVDAILGEIEEFLTGARRHVETDRVLATVLFTDIVDATTTAVHMGDRRWSALLDTHHAAVRAQLERFRGREIDTAGDGFLASFDGPARAVRAACAMVESVRKMGLTIRTGLHTGECQVFGNKLAGVAVHIGARIASVAAPGEVLVSGTVKDLVAGSGLRFRDRGVHELKGIPGTWPLYRVESA